MWSKVNEVTRRGNKEFELGRDGVNRLRYSALAER